MTSKQFEDTGYRVIDEAGEVPEHVWEKSPPHPLYRPRWAPIEGAPKNGSVVLVSNKDARFPMGVACKARFLNGKWCARVGNDRWLPFSPQPDIYQPGSEKVTAKILLSTGL